MAVYHRIAYTLAFNVRVCSCGPITLDRREQFNWTVDVIWDEDTKAWCGQGLGIQILGLLRLMAYNMVSRLRCRYLRTRERMSVERRRWKELCDVLFVLICQGGSDLFPHRQTTAGM
jgi:hypothetical protein